MLARHVIGWALVPPNFTDASCLPTTLEGARTFLDRAALQEAELLRHLGIDAGHLTAVVSDGSAYDEFFAVYAANLPWYDDGDRRALVAHDVGMVNGRLRELRGILAHWQSDDIGLASTATLTPLRSAAELCEAFRSLSAFAADLLEVLSDCPLTGLVTFYDYDERRRRSIPPSRPS